MKYLLKAYIREVLTGFRSLSSTGPDRALGNLRQGVGLLSQRNKSVLDDAEDEKNWEVGVNPIEDTIPYTHGTIP